jgi:hypothetical protein
MRAVATIVLVVSLITCLSVHVVLLYRLGKVRGVAGVVFPLIYPPLAPLWAYDASFKREAFIWVASVVAYAAGVALAAL